MRSFVNGGAPPVMTTELASYHGAAAKAAGARTAAEQATIKTVQAKVAAIAGSYVDSGGTGGRQAAAALDILDFSSRLEAARSEAINQWAKSSDPRKANREMHGVDTQFFIELLRKILELEARVNDSPY